MNQDALKLESYRMRLLEYIDPRLEVIKIIVIESELSVEFVPQVRHS